MATALIPFEPSLFTSRSAPRLVRTKMSASSRSARSSARRASKRFSWVTPTKRCSTWTSLFGATCSCRTGESVYFLAMRSTSPSSVAENSIVWRSLGVAAMMRSTSGRKPMSSMRSASSRTRILVFLSETAPRSMRSSRRPGVATRICARRASFACFCDAGAAVDGCDREVAHRGDRPEVFSDLKRELAGGSDDERRAGRRFQAKLLDDRSGEGKGLARPGGGLDEDVAAGECVADHECLDCKRFCDASLGEDIADGRRHAKIREGLVRHIGAFFFATRGVAV